MINIAEYYNNAVQFNSRVADIAKRTHQLFNIDIDFEPVQAQLPDRFNADALDYVKSVEHQVIYNLNALLLQLSRYHIVAPKSFVVFNFSWSEVNAALQQIEQRLAQY